MCFITDIGIIAPGQLGEKQKQLSKEVEAKIKLVAGEKSVKKQQSSESMLQRINTFMRTTGTVAKDFWNRMQSFFNGFPGSG